MASAPPPAKLNHRHHLLAYLLVAGKTDKDAAEALGYSAVRVAQIKRSPLFTVLCNELRAEIADKHVTDVAAWLERETTPTLKRLRELRDQDDSLPVAATVSLALYDRLSPKITKHENETVHRHVWDRRDVQAMARVMREDEGGDPGTVDAEFTAVDAEQAALPAGTEEAVDAGVPSIDEVLEEFEGER